MGGWPLPNLAGKKIGNWSVLRRATTDGPTKWLCRCSCGEEREVSHGNLNRASSTNCGCIAYKNRQGGRNLRITEKDADLPNEFWCTLLRPWNGVTIQASTAGRVRHASSGHVYRMFSEGGYLKTTIRGEIAKIHRIIATTFHPNPNELPEVNHKDGRKKNNAPDNLEWSTHADNIAHAWEIGLCKPQPGSQNPAAKLTEAQVVDIRTRYVAGKIKQSELAAEFGVSQRAVSLIVRREKWTHV